MVGTPQKSCELTPVSTPTKSLNKVLNREHVKKRSDYIEWDEYFMGIACLVAKRSKDPSSQVGACIVNRNNRIVGQGYNGMPQGCSDDEFPWNKTSVNPLENKYLYVVHAELNAIIYMNPKELKNCVIYSVLFPCNECAKSIIQTGITEVVYMCGKNLNKVEAIAAKRMFDAAGVTCRQYVPKHDHVVIDFTENATKNGLKYLTPMKTQQGASPARFVSPGSRDINSKREDCMEWEEYFMAITFLVAKRSKDPTAQSGACIVDTNNRIIGQGYNGLPFGCSDDEFPWGTKSTDPLENKDLYICHAEINAILNKNCMDLKGCKMYCVSFPCNECAKTIIQAGISEVIYMSDEYIEEIPLHAAQRMFNAAGVVLRQYVVIHDRLVIDFTEINWSSATQLPPTPCKDLTRMF